MRLKFSGILCLFLLMSFRLASAQVPAPDSSMNDQSDDDDNTKPAATAVNTFGMKLLADVASQRRHENVFISPLSVFVALTMTETGAAGKTQAAMRNALAIPNSLSDDALHQSASGLLKSL